MNQIAQKAQALAAMQGFELASDGLRDGQRRCMMAEEAARKADDAERTRASFREQAEKLLRTAIEEKKTHGGRLITIADLDAACKKLNSPWPLCSAA